MRTLIIGGGIGGLALAFRLLQRGVAPESITVVEASSRWGGLLQSTRRDGLLVEHGPDSIIRSKPAGVALWRDLGLEDEFVATEPASRQALIAKGTRLIPVPEGLYLLAPGKIWPFLTSPLLSWPGKLRAGLDLVLPRRAADAAEESLGQFVRRRFGRELFERIAQPMVSGIYTADPERLSVAAAMPQFIEWEREHRSLILAARARTRDQAASGPRYGLFVSLRDGLHRCVERLLERLAGVDLRLNTPVRELTRTTDGWQATSDTITLAGDRLAIAGPAHLAATLVRKTDAVLADELAGIPYAGAAILNLSFASDQLPALPVAAGFVVPAIEKRTILATTFMSVKYAGRAPAGTHLLRVFLGGAGNEAVLDLPDGELIRRACGDLRDLIGLRGEPLLAQVDRWPRSMAQFHLGHRAKVTRIRARESALSQFGLLGNGYEGVGIPDVIAQADTLASRWNPR